MNHSEIVSFFRGVAALIRDSFKPGKYQDVILPLAVLRRLDCVLAPIKGEGAAPAGRAANGSTTQRSIADFLDRKTTKMDALVAKVREAIDRLEELRIALVSAAVTGKIDVREASP